MKNFERISLNSRFTIDKESTDIFNWLREDLKQVQKQYPFIKGLGFFGSRTLGRNHAKSDIDLCVFYDTSEPSIDDAITTKYLSETIKKYRRQNQVYCLYRKKLIQMLDRPNDVLTVDIST